VKLFLIGGFLGSGKTTAIQKACSQFQVDKKVGVITNDQGVQLVDTGFIESFDIATREVIKGCFCCNYRELEAAIDSLSKSEQPEIIFAESVGSCTDLIATIVNPLLKFHPTIDITVSIFADAQILLQRLCGEQNLFEEDVQYIYDKQLEEADVLVVNKIDLLKPDQVIVLKNHLQKQHPTKTILFQNSLNKESISSWLEKVNDFSLKEERKTLDLDYQKYGDGEAKLAWLDEEVEVVTYDNTAIEVAYAFMNKFHERIKEGGFTIGHLKFLLNDGHVKRKISFVTMLQPACMPNSVNTQVNRVIIIINARVQMEPPSLKELLAKVIAEVRHEKDCKVIERKMLAFKPGFPTPTYRMQY
jgi:G3E family GTPase